MATNYTEHYMAALLPLVVASDDDEDDEEGACKPKVERMFLRFMRRFFFEAATDGEVEPYAMALAVGFNTTP